MAYYSVVSVVSVAFSINSNFANESRTSRTTLGKIWMALSLVVLLIFSMDLLLLLYISQKDEKQSYYAKILPTIAGVYFISNVVKVYDTFIRNIIILFCYVFQFGLVFGCHFYGQFYILYVCVLKRCGLGLFTVRSGGGVRNCCLEHFLTEIWRVIALLKSATISVLLNELPEHFFFCVEWKWSWLFRQNSQMISSSDSSECLQAIGGVGINVENHWHF